MTPPPFRHSSGSSNSAELELLLPAVRSYLLCSSRHESPDADTEAAWKRFYRIIEGVVRASEPARSMTWEVRDDYAQEVLQKLLTAIRHSAYEPQRGRFLCWLFVLMRNVAADRDRAEDRHPTVALEAEQEAALLSRDPDPAEAVERQELREFVSSLLDRLGEQVSALNRQVLRLYWREQCSIGEIASALQLAPEQVSTRIYQMKLLCVRLYRSRFEKFFAE